MRILPIILSLLSLSTGLKASTEEMVPSQWWFLEEMFEASALAFYNGELVTVSDDDKQRAVYRLIAKGDHDMDLNVMVNLPKLTGYHDVVEQLANTEKITPGSGRFDLEALAVCGDDIYIANERARVIYKITGPIIKVLPLGWGELQEELSAGGLNAGIEALAVDCSNHLLYVGKEREPRMIYVWDLNNYKLKERFDIIPSGRVGQKFLNADQPDSPLEIPPDFADFYFENGFLYALERNTREIAKIDLKTKTVVSRLSYIKFEWGLYDTPLPFGEAEGLVMNKESIYLAIDNNKNFLSHAAKAKYNTSGQRGVLAKFKRPMEF